MLKFRFAGLVCIRNTIAGLVYANISPLGFVYATISFRGARLF